MSLSRRWVWAGGGLTLLAVAVAATSQPLTLFRLPPDPGLDGGPGVHGVDGTSSWDMWVDPGPARSLTSPIGLLSLAFLALLVVALVVFVVVVVRAARGHGAPSGETQDRRAGLRFDRVAATRPVAEAVQTALAGLRGDGSVADAVIACWVSLQHTAERLGLPREESETSAQYAYRLGSELDLSSVALQTLAALYREARFSEHPIGDGERARALSALQELQVELDRRRTPVGSGRG